MNYTKDKWIVSSEMTYRSYGEEMKAFYILGEINGQSDRTIAEVGCWKDRSNALDDAHLIAAAPDMYEALKMVKKCLDRPYCDSWHIAIDGKGKRGLGDMVNKALAKAEAGQ
jgi:hypothetical protein